MNASAPKFPDTLAPFVSTPEDVVARMLDLAEVSATDTLYDLGCGDGRIIVGAAQRGARAVGFDIQTGLRDLTLDRIKAAGVEHLAEYRMQDALTVDLRPASVIAVYLVHWAMARFQPIIQKTCRPGTRIVSHSFSMPDWQPEKVEKFTDIEGQPRTLFLWRVGA